MDTHFYVIWQESLKYLEFFSSINLKMFSQQKQHSKGNIQFEAQINMTSLSRTKCELSLLQFSQVHTNTHATQRLEWKSNKANQFE